MKRINLTQHVAQQEQACISRTPEFAEAVQKLLTFEELPLAKIISARAGALAQMAKTIGADEAMIGGAPYLMPALEIALLAVGVDPVYAFSKRVSIEEIQKDGSIIKRTVFKHLGFVHHVHTG